MMPLQNVLLPRLCRLCILLLCLSLDPVMSALGIGDEICLEGFIMDLFCINRGTLFDNPRVRTLENPEKHSIHCLVDVSQCHRSGYEVLIDPRQNEPLPSPPYRRGYMLDPNGNAMIRNFAQRSGLVGFCATCTGEVGEETNGFRAAVNGTISDVGDSATPPTIAVKNIISASIGCPEGTPEVPIPVLSESSVGGDVPFILSHGSLMMIGWGFLLPAGVLNARMLRHRPNALWFKVHRAFQVAGLLVALPAWIIAIKKFDVFGDPWSRSYIHGFMGMLTMAMGLFQPINALLRPHPPAADEKKSGTRQAWEYTHKFFGYGSVVIAACTIALGTTLLPTLEQQRIFQLAYVVGAGGVLVCLAIFLVKDKKKYANRESAESKGETA